MADSNTKERKGYAQEIPPLESHVIIYFSQKGLPEQTAREFFKECRSRDWKSLYGTPIKNWKACANEWIWEYCHSKKGK